VPAFAKGWFICCQPFAQKWHFTALKAHNAQKVGSIKTNLLQFSEPESA
jgi:hypothetical protein